MKTVSRILKIFVPAVLLFAGTALYVSAEPVNGKRLEPLERSPVEEILEETSDYDVLLVDASAAYTGSESYDYCTAKAETKALEKAVALAGTTVTSGTIDYEKFQNENGVSESTRRSVHSSIFSAQALLLDYTAKHSRKLFNERDSRYVCRVRARVKVWKLGPDPKFAFTAVPAGEKRGRVERLEAFRHGERIDFELNSSIDAYLAVFWVGADGTAQLVVQSDAEHGKLRLRAGARTIFSKLVGVPLAVTADKDAREDGQVLFVATKTERAFPYVPGEDGKRTCSRLLTWLAEIRPDERRYKSVPFIVVK